MEVTNVALAELQKKMDKIYVALMGSEISKDGGIIGRLERIEKKQEDTDLNLEALEENMLKQFAESDIKTAKMETTQKFLYIAIGAGVSLLFSLLVEHFFN